MLKALFRLFGSRGPSTVETPLRDELLSIERLEERAKALAARFTVDPDPGRDRSVFPRLDDNARVLSAAYRTLADDVHQGAFIWMYRAGLESILGLKRRGATFEIDPCIPSSWPDYAVVWRFGGARYEIAVSNPERRCQGIAEAELDGAPVDAHAIPLVDDGGTHHLKVVLGDGERISRRRARPGTVAPA